MKYLINVMAGLVLAGWNAAAEPLKQVPAGHPRLLGGAREFAVLRERAKTDPLVAAGVKAVRMQADWSLKRPPLQRKLQGFRLLGVCRDALARISSQAMTYRLTDDRRYLEAARKVALDACAFEDWNPQHFLDVSEMSLAVALAYDWLYADLSSEDREALAAGLKRHGFDEFVKDAARPRGSRMRANSNWGQVCSCGAIAAALALWEREGAAASELLEKAVDSLRVPMCVYAPKGAYPEGPGYWAYGTGFNVIAIGLLQHACGTDFGLSEIEGFKATAYFRDWTTGPSGQMFNFSDSGLKRSPSPSAWWFAANGEPACVEFFERPALLGDLSARSVPRTFACALFWLLDLKPATWDRRPLVWDSGDATGLVAMRSDWTTNAWFAAFKGGLVGANHGHLDVGSFVFDAYGLRWAGDMGSEGYHHIESKGIALWNRKQDSERWRLYRLANASHNVINPGAALQNVGKSGRVVDVRETDGICTAAFDLDAIYAPTIGGWKRRATLKGGLFTVEDEILGANGVSVPWGFSTQADATVEGREVRLTQKDRTLIVRAEAPAEAVWTVGPAEGNHPADSKNPSWTRVTLTAPAAEKVVYRVSFVEPPAEKGPATAKTPDIAREIQDWEVQTGLLPRDPNEKVVEAPDGMTLFLLVGQSNMAGRAKVPEEDRRALPRAYKLNRDDAWVPATAPFHFDRATAGMSPANEFVKRYLADHPNESVGVVPCAVGGSQSATWEAHGEGKVGANFRRALARAKTAKRKGRFAAILWHQGESDAGASVEELKRYYPKRFAAMIAAFRQEIGDVPVVAGEIGRFMPAEAAKVNPVLDGLPHVVPNCRCVTSKDLKNQDKWHFDLPSTKEFGRRYYEAFRDLQDPAQLVSVTSTADGTPQPAWFWAPKAEAKKPLLVELHSWSYGCTTDGRPHTVFLDRCRRAGWAFVLPNFRGPNETPQACGSDLAVQDVMDAVAYAKAQTAVDEDRIYLVGSSGGGMMTLLMAGRHPDVWAACYAACPISDIARWHAETSSFADWRVKYAGMMEKSCGGKPDAKPEEYAHRSPLTHLAAARRQGTVIDICEGIHDGHTGSVPVGHSFRAFNALADEKDRISDADIATFERAEKTPDALAGEWQDPFFGEKLRIHFRRVSANVRLTIFEGGHAGNMSAGFEWMGRQRRGRPADWSVAARGVGAEDVSTK